MLNSATIPTSSYVEIYVSHEQTHFNQVLEPLSIFQSLDFLYFETCDMFQGEVNVDNAMFILMFIMLNVNDLRLVQWNFV